MEIIDYKSSLIQPIGQPGRRLASASVICAVIDAANGSFACLVGYGAYPFDTRQLAFLLLMLLSCVIGFVGLFLGAFAMAQSRGKRGLIGVILSIIATIGVVFLASRVPQTPLPPGALH